MSRLPGCMSLCDTLHVFGNLCNLRPVWRIRAVSSNLAQEPGVYQGTCSCDALGLVPGLLVTQSPHEPPPEGGLVIFTSVPFSFRNPRSSVVC